MSSMSKDATEKYRGRIDSNGTLKIQNDSSLSSLLGFGQIGELQNLFIIDCPNFTNLSGIAELQKTLESLHVVNTGLNSTKALENMNSVILNEIELTHNKSLFQIEGILDVKKNLPNVRTLKLSSNSLENLRDIRSLRFVTYLDVSGNNIRDVNELRYLQNFPFCTHINIFNNPVCENQDFEKILKFCVSRNTIQVLIYRKDGQNEINDQSLAQIRQLQDYPLTPFKQNEYSCIDYHRILLTEWDIQDIEERDQPLSDELTEVEEYNAKMKQELLQVQKDQQQMQKEMELIDEEIATINREINTTFYEFQNSTITQQTKIIECLKPQREQ